MSNSIRKIDSSVSASACVHSEQSPFQIPPRHESEQFVLCHEVPIGQQYRLTNNTVDFLDFFLLSGEAERIAEMATATNIQHNCENHRPLDRRRRRMSAAAAAPASASLPSPSAPATIHCTRAHNHLSQSVSAETPVNEDDDDAVRDRRRDRRSVQDREKKRKEGECGCVAFQEIVLKCRSE